MDAQALQAQLDSLIECWENEVVEFQCAGLGACRKSVPDFQGKCRIN